MRALLLLGALGLGGCPSKTPNGDCSADVQCGAEVCARDGECVPRTEVYAVKISWKIRGTPAGPTTCAAFPNFFINFSDLRLGEAFGFSPVPCDAGQFFVDKLPTRFTQTELGVDNQWSELADIDPRTGQATFDLAP